MVVSSLSQDGQLAVVASLSSVYEGSVPSSPLVMSPSGDLIGYTWVGGPLGWGTVFKISTMGVSTFLRTFPALQETVVRRSVN